MNCKLEWFEKCQPIALFLIVLGALVVFMGCHWRYAELTTLGAGIAGAGIQKVTSTTHNSTTLSNGTLTSDSTGSATTTA